MDRLWLALMIKYNCDCPSVYLSEPSFTRATFALYRYIMQFWNQDDPRIENLLFEI